MVWLASSVRDQVSKIADAKTLDKVGAMDEWMYGLVYPLTTFRHAEGAERQSLFILSLCFKKHMGDQRMST